MAQLIFESLGFKIIIIDWGNSSFKTSERVLSLNYNLQCCNFYQIRTVNEEKTAIFFKEQKGFLLTNPLPPEIPVLK